MPGTTSIGLVPQLQSLAQNFIQKEMSVVKATDTVSKALTGPNGLKLPSASSLQKLLGSLPTGISTIQTAVQSFSASSFTSLSLDGGGFLNSAIGTAQNLVGAVTSVVGAAGSLGLNVGALGGITQALTGVNPGIRIGGGGTFGMTPSFEYEIPSASTGYAYPLDLDTDTKMERIQLSIAQYKKNEIIQPASYIPENSIFLPIPRDLREGYAPGWRGYAPGFLRGMIANVADKIKGGADISSLAKDIGMEAENVYNQLASGEGSTEEKVTQISSALQFGLYYTIGPGDNRYQALSNFTGRAVNPYTTVAFEGVGLRQHTFVWILAPKSLEESNRLADIIHILRKAALPKDNGGFFLEYPKVVNVKFLPDEKKLYNFKRCVINMLEIDHAGSGQPSFFNSSGYPTVYVIRLGLQEIEQYTSNDVGQSSENTSRKPDFSPTNIFRIEDNEDNVLPPSRSLPSVQTPPTG